MAFVPNTNISENVTICDSMEFFNDLINDDDKIGENIPATCLITGSELCHPIAELSCKHRFNYPALHSCLYTQLYKTNAGITTYPKLYESRVYFLCPYCRSPQSNLLPYYNDVLGKRLFLINSDDIHYNPKSHLYGTIRGICNWVINAKYKNIATPCDCSYVKLHVKTNKYYCLRHMLNAEGKYQTELKNKQKLIEKEKQKLIKKEERHQRAEMLKLNTKSKKKKSQPKLTSRDNEIQSPDTNNLVQG